METVVKRRSKRNIGRVDKVYSKYVDDSDHDQEDSYESHDPLLLKRPEQQNDSPLKIVKDKDNISSVDGDTSELDEKIDQESEFNQEASPERPEEPLIDIIEGEPRKKQQSPSPKEAILLVSCIKCEECFFDSATFRTHYREVHKETNFVFKCPFCSCSYRQCNALNRHRQRTHEEQTKCPKCDRIFSAYYLWKFHYLTHAEKKPFTCDSCEKSFVCKRSLDLHRKKHIPIEERYSCTCELCGKQFTGQAGLKLHMKIHRGEKGFVCEVCGNEFRTKGAVKAHQRTHTGEKPYDCNMCDKSFAQRKNLVYHKAWHRGDKPYICEACNKAFSTHDNLKRHSIVHSDERPFICQFCGRQFRRKRMQQVHERIHTGERPYECKLCNSTFYDTGNMAKHMRTVHKQKRKRSCYVLSESHSSVSLEHGLTEEEKKTNPTCQLIQEHIEPTHNAEAVLSTLQLKNESNTGNDHNGEVFSVIDNHSIFSGFSNWQGWS